MKIGIFDSGLGGLNVTHSLIAALPQYDYVYLGDTARVPYGDRSEEVIYEFTEQGVDYLFQQDCQLIILACNTMSAEALRKIQQEYLPAHYPDRRVLGVIIPAAEEVVTRTKNGKAGIIATQATISSKAYIREIHKLDASKEVFQQATPLLVPLVENNALKYAGPILDDYLKPLLAEHIDTLVLGCTHYSLLKRQIQEKVGAGVRLVSQDELIPAKLADYLHRHDEIAQKLSSNDDHQFLVTDLAPATQHIAAYLFGHEVELEKVTLGSS
jgi:glutamate racemase